MKCYEFEQRKKIELKLPENDDVSTSFLSLSLFDVISHLQSKRAKTFAFPNENGGRKGGSKFP